MAGLTSMPCFNAINSPLILFFKMSPLRRGFYPQLFYSIQVNKVVVVVCMCSVINRFIKYWSNVRAQCGTQSSVSGKENTEWERANR